MTEDLYQIIATHGGFSHGGTLSHHPACAAAGLANVGILEREGLVDWAHAMGPLLGRKLNEALGDSPFVADIQGLGMLCYGG